MISSERPIDCTSMRVAGVVDRAHDVAHLVDRRALTSARTKRSGASTRVVGLVLGGERDAALAQRALERVERRVRCAAPRRCAGAG